MKEKHGRLESLCVAWQERLRLRDWQVRVRAVPPGEIDGDGVYGKIEWRLHHKTAKIAIVDSLDMARDDPQYDQERTLVHELLHLHFLAWQTESGTPADTALEQALTVVAGALVALRHADDGHAT